ncbi:MAG TPA: hypothetical protein VJ875_13975 [Pyrinomonadaceae bacterium]|nr:hypothetical protein [Pyrinomonadaceae bacterium]
MSAERLASKYAKEMQLRCALAIKSAVFQITNSDRLVYVAEEWMFTYARSDKEWVSVSVNSEGTTTDGLDDGVSAPGEQRSYPAAEYPPISGWKIDSDKACTLVERYGGHLQTGGWGGTGLLQLRTANVDGENVPLWWVPHRLQWYPVFIRADTGTLVFIKDDEQFLFTETAPPDVKFPKVNLREERADDLLQRLPNLNLHNRVGKSSSTKQSPTAKLTFKTVLLAVLGILAVLLLSGYLLRAWLAHTPKGDDAASNLSKVSVRQEAPSPTRQETPQKSSNTSQSEMTKFSPIWSNETVTKQNKATFITTETIYSRPPFYDGPAPFTVRSGVRPFFDQGTVKVYSEFGDFRNTYIYDQVELTAGGIASGARATNSSGQLLAEARLLRLRTSNNSFQGVELEEFHYGLDGQLTFRCKSQIDSHGFKVNESEASGTKAQDYFFIWPVSLR